MKKNYYEVRSDESSSEEFDSLEDLFDEEIIRLFKNLRLEEEIIYANSLFDYMDLLAEHSKSEIFAKETTEESIRQHQEELNNIRNLEPSPCKNPGEAAREFAHAMLIRCDEYILQIQRMYQDVIRYPMFSQRIIQDTVLDTTENHQQLKQVKEHDKSLSQGIGRLRFQYKLLSSESAQSYFEYLLQNCENADGHASLLYELIQLNLDSEKNRNALGNSHPEAYTVSAVVESCRLEPRMTFLQDDYDLIVKNVKFSHSLSFIFCWLKEDNILTRENFDAVMKYVDHSNEIYCILKNHKENDDLISQEKFSLAIKQVIMTSIPSLKNQQNNLLWQEPIVPTEDLQLGQKFLN